jgi:8-amino-7-oxononanoate synthase
MNADKTEKKLPTLFDKCYDYRYADDVKAAGIYPYFRPIEESEGPVVRMDGKKIIMAGSNNYLGLTAHPKVKEATANALKTYGTSCSGSRYLTGTIPLHQELEAKLAAFVGKEDALLFSTGYQTSQGVIQPLVKRNDTIFSDKDNHASIQTGNFVARGSTGTNIIRYKHCSIEDLEMKLAKLPIEAGKFIVTDGVFSTFGNIADMQKITALAKKYNAKTLVDDAHSFGVLGEGGRGTSSEFNVTNDVDLIMCTFSKTLASLGGFVAGEERVINYLKHHSPALIFSASPTPPSVAAAIAALDIVQQEPERVQHLVNNAEFVRSGLKDAGFNVIDGRTAIVPVLIGDNKQAFGLWKGLFDEGIFVNVFIPPATPPNKSMMRNSFMATHKKEHLEKVVDCYTKIGKRLGII